jgi:hypothetical protein
MGKSLSSLGVVFGVLFCLLFTGLSAGATQKAFLIGIGTYEHLPYITSKGERLDNLRGPDNDVQKIKDLLVSGYNFSPDNVLVLKDQEASREAIISHFNQWLVKGTRPGDLVLFYYSGHGTRIPKAPTGFYKAICPYDTLMNAKNLIDAKLIINEELGDLLGKLKGREVVVIMDSCHSGGMTRSIRGRPVDQLELTPAIQSKFLPMEIADVDSAEMTRGKGFNITKQGDGFEDRISILSSKEDQMSVEMAFPSGVIHGAFTAALLEGVRGKENISYGEWFERAKKTVKDNFRLEQDPQLKTTRGKMLTQAVFKYPPTTAGPTGMANQKSKVTSQKAFNPSTLDIKEGKILVRLDPIKNIKPEDQENLKRNLLTVSHIELVDAEIFDCLIRGEFKNNQYQLRLVSPMGDKQKIPPFEDMEGFIKGITPYLEYKYLLKKLGRINNPHPTFNVKVWMKEKDRRNYRVGEKAQFYISSDQDCYLVMLNLDSQGDMRVLFPNQYFRNNFIKAGRVIKIPDGKMGQKFELEFGEPVGEEVVKVIATIQPLKLEDLGLAEPEPEGKLKPQALVKSKPQASGNLQPEVITSNLVVFGPRGLIEVPQGSRSIVVKKVEEIPLGKAFWSEDSIVIRSHK